MLMDLYGGQIDMGAGSLAGLGGGIQKGNVRPIVIIIGNRSSRLPGIPTWVDAGFKGQPLRTWPSTTCCLPRWEHLNPSSTVWPKLVQESITESAKVKAVRDTMSADDVPLTGAALQQFIARTWPSYRKLTREMGLAAE